MNESQETREETDFSFNFADFVDHDLKTILTEVITVYLVQT